MAGTCLWTPGGVGSIENIKMVVTVHVESFKTEQKLLQDGLGLEGDDAIDVPLVPADHNCAVDCLGYLGPKVSILGIL